MALRAKPGDREQNLSADSRSLKIVETNLIAHLKSNLLFLIFSVPRQAVRAPFGGPAETGAGGVQRLLVPILLNGGFGYEDYLRFCSPLAIDHRL